MKILLFSDLHADVSATRRLVKQACEADIVIGAGDLGNVRRHLRTSVDILQAIDRPTLLVAGNNETTNELTEACRDWPQAYVLHGSGTTIEGLDFYGIGGGIPVTPFGSWSYDFTEEQATELLHDCPQGCVLISHSPPKGVVDRASNGQSLGSVAIRDAILAKKPRLVVCGHIHGSAGRKAILGDSPVINAGPNGIVWEIA